ncbi:MAG TPA: sigma-70 family RNA polymerase sigma factor [Bryobacterales bacterium]|nr:sigma-70 family RNA polymerase sigma factor [Bryobacterales bacterium]
MEFRTFDKDYVQRLAQGDRVVQDHFAAYFGELLYIKLRGRVRSSDAIDDIRQETFKRVLQAASREGGIEQPERLGAYVVSVCNKVVSEGSRNGAKHIQTGQEMDARADSRIDLDAPLVNRERRRVVEDVLAKLSRGDQKLLRMIFLDEKNKAEACRQLGVGEDYLRVLLHRAKSRFRKKLAELKDSAILNTSRLRRV